VNIAVVEMHLAVVGEQRAVRSERDERVVDAVLARCGRLDHTGHQMHPVVGRDRGESGDERPGQRLGDGNDPMIEPADGEHRILRRDHHLRPGLGGLAHMPAQLMQILRRLGGGRELDHRDLHPPGPGRRGRGRVLRLHRSHRIGPVAGTATARQ
jgi:hypothetical protein